METWSVMEENQISLDSYSSLLMIRALGEGGYLDEVNFIKQEQPGKKIKTKQNKK